MNQTLVTRRSALAAGLVLAGCAQTTTPSRSYTPPPNDERFAAIETRIGGRVGVAALNTASGDWLGHRLQERFAMCSTFKWLLAAQMLHLDMHRPGFREQQLRFAESDLLDHAPTARQHLARGWMTVEEACEAAVVVSDNTCANLLLASADGPEGLTRFLRANGDGLTRLDRTEPELNIVPPGEERDTTTPETMVRTLQRFLLTDAVLNPSSREQLIGWMVASTTGRERLRAGLPADWRVGDKTGTMGLEPNATNDVAIAWPPNRAPILIAAYFSGSTVDFRARNAAHAEIARIVAGQWS